MSSPVGVLAKPKQGYPRPLYNQILPGMILQLTEGPWSTLKHGFAIIQAYWIYWVPMIVILIYPLVN